MNAIGVGALMASRLAAMASVAVGHAALDVAIANYPGQRFTLRNGALVIRQHWREVSRASEVSNFDQTATILGAQVPPC